MPSIREFQDRATSLLEDYIARRDEKLGAGLLPADLCQHITEKAQRWAVGVRAYLKDVDAQLERLRAELKGAEALVRAEHRPIPGRVRVVGDVLSTTSKVERGPSLGSIKPEKALALQHAKVDPLRAKIAALEAHKYDQERGLAELRKIVRLASHGDIALLNHLTAAWRTRLEIGGAVLGKLPPAARALAAKVDAATPTDAAGNPLPPEALDAEGRPDMAVPLTGEAVSETLARTGYGQRGAR